MIDISKLDITIDNIEYIGGDLDPQAQELLRHVVDIRERKKELLFQMTQLDVADHAFSEALRKYTPPVVKEVG